MAHPDGGQVSGIIREHLSPTKRREVVVIAENEKGYLCQKCGKWYSWGIPNISCAVLHPPGQCCHYTQVEIEPPVPVRIGDEKEVIFPDVAEMP